MIFTVKLPSGDSLSPMQLAEAIALGAVPEPKAESWTRELTHKMVWNGERWKSACDPQELTESERAYCQKILAQVPGDFFTVEPDQLQPFVKAFEMDERNRTLGDGRYWDPHIEYPDKFTSRLDAGKTSRIKSNIDFVKENREKLQTQYGNDIEQAIRAGEIKAKNNKSWRDTVECTLTTVIPMDAAIAYLRGQGHGVEPAGVANDNVEGTDNGAMTPSTATAWSAALRSDQDPASRAVQPSPSWSYRPPKRMRDYNAAVAWALGEFLRSGRITPPTAVDVIDLWKKTTPHPEPIISVVDGDVLYANRSDHPTPIGKNKDTTIKSVQEVIYRLVTR